MINTKLLISLAAFAVFLLFGTHVLPYLNFDQESLRIAPGDVEAVEIYHKQTPYILNFSQQNQLIGRLNQAVHVPKLRNPPKNYVDGIEKIIIRRFSKDPINLTPIGTAKTNVYFVVPEWYETGYLMDESGLELRRLLSESHDD